MEDILNAEVLGGEIIRHAWRMGLGDVRRDRAHGRWSSHKKAGFKLGVRWHLERRCVSPKDVLLPAE